ncbi:MAG: hypothetical protein Q7V04_04280 [Deltaproteobacteria bacterium]|nr:hypothetical protein [Deltaproteobacteria bacterium]
MRMLLRCCAVMSLVALLAIPVVAGADEPENYSGDAEYAEDAPPMIPHRIEDTSNGEYCLGCHRTGLHGAPLSPHAVRLSCTGCHAQGEIREMKREKKEKEKKKKK